MEAIVAAAITAIASIIVAVIQAISAQKQASILREQALQATSIPTSEREQIAPEDPPQIEPEMVSVPTPSAKILIGRFDRIWWLVGGVIAAEAIIFGIVNEDLTPFVNNLILIPLTTCPLSFFRPVFWGYAAVFVTLLQGTSILGYFLGGGTFVKGDLQTIALIFIANAGICALISSVRLRQKVKRLSEQR